MPTFDLTVPGAGEYSMFNVFAKYGYDVWGIDFEGYGRSSVTPGWSDIKSGVADLAAMVPIVERETRQRGGYHMIGKSSGALRVAAFAAQYPDRAGRLVFSAYTYTGKDSPTLTERAKNLEFYQENNRRPRPKEMLESIFTRDKAGTSDPRTAAALVAAELPFGDTVPTGTYLDMTSKLPIIEAKRHQVASAGDPRRARRHRDRGGPAGLLQQAAERRPSVRDPCRAWRTRWCWARTGSSSGTRATRSWACRSRWSRSDADVLKKARPVL